MLHKLASLTLPLLAAFWACAERPSLTQSGTAWAAAPVVARTLATADLILAIADDGGSEIEPGDLVVVIADGAKFMMGQEVVAKLDAGTELRVNRTDGSWLGSQIDVLGKKRGGWIKRSEVKLSSGTAPAAPVASDAGPVDSPDNSGADAPPGDSHPAVLQERFDVDVMVILSDAEVAGIDRSARINKLKLTGPGVTNAALNDLHELALVNLLSIESTRITNAGLGLLKDATNVRSLRLWQRAFSDAALRQVKKLTALESLDLEGTEVTGEELAELKDLAKLRILVLGPATEDAQMEALGNLPLLEELDLRCCRNLSDAGVAHLDRLTKLKDVWLPRQITDEGEIRLMQKLPDCKIQR